MFQGKSTLDLKLIDKVKMHSEHSKWFLKIPKSQPISLAGQDPRQYCVEIVQDDQFDGGEADSSVFCELSERGVWSFLANQRGDSSQYSQSPWLNETESRTGRQA